MNETDADNAKPQPNRGLLRRLIEHLLAGIIGFVFSFPIAVLVCLFLFCGGVWWVCNAMAFFAIIGVCTAITAISPNVGGEIVGFVSDASKGYLNFICDILEAFCLPVD
ncbi:hypothetical protein FHS27_006400 [Rhodopirellula rubra]|uniref:Transmembrane protein n=1 Tax=Aporhodopirellula rubra TaxID=980271 RepID=A0A7W5E6M8_9BACT|nr:hypothetical protein [Aporhodopirellula rubra]MBB3210553.1 hypothetical protein [Aporhodopirellula rubra]